MSSRVFLLSPAYAGGQRAHLLLSESAQFDLARRLQSNKPPTLGEVFSFLSGLYFRGKLAYATTFAATRARDPDILVITPNRGLLPVLRPLSLAELQAFAEVDIAADDPRYRAPLERDVRKLVRRLGPKTEVILLGSIATGKYVDVLLDLIGARLLFPADFVGRGDMSRGGLLLRCAVDRRELDYIPVAGAARKGKRPPKLTPRRYLK
ncbi:MAG: hypothetical protein ABIR71_03610 [Chthoniobacterales bacterium]